MSATFNTQLTFDWANEHPSQTPVVIPKSNREARQEKSSKPEQKLVRKAPATGSSVNLGVPVTAKPMDEILAEHKSSSSARRNRTEHISDLLLVVLDRYGISPDEFLATLHD